MNWLQHPRLIQCANALADGGVIAYPTEAVWGLGCDPFNIAAVQHILHLKRRSVEKGLILVAACIEQFDFVLAPLTQKQRATLAASWPGHTTWLVPHNDLVPTYLSGKHSSIALRVSAHPLVQALCLLHKGPIVSTSANPQGLPPARDALKARMYFGSSGNLHYAPAAPATAKAPSQIRDLLSGQQLR
jgi:L-threonylcarbamoyladenylate synthase